MKLGKRQGMVLGFGLGVFAITALRAVRKRQRRSMRSWLIEKGLFIYGMKAEQEQMLEGDLAEFIAWNTKAVKKPDKLVGKVVTEEILGGMQVFHWNQQADRKQPVIFYLHGGGNAFPPYFTHYLALRQIVHWTNAQVIMPIYLKSPKYSYQDSLPLVRMAYLRMLEQTPKDNPIILMGDSSGGGMALGLADYMASHYPQIRSAAEIILLSPWLDMREHASELTEFAALDPMISQSGLKLASKYWVGLKGDVNSPEVSPISVSGQALGTISLFVGSHEIFYPDIIKYAQQLAAEGVDHRLFIYPKMNHIFPVYPTPEGKHARRRIARIIQQAQQKSEPH